jgi:hypothetical protein
MCFLRQGLVSVITTIILCGPLNAAPAKNPEDAVVFIEVFVNAADDHGRTQLKKVGQGSGLVINEAGWVLTAAHVTKMAGANPVFKASVRSKYLETVRLLPLPTSSGADGALLQFPPGLGKAFQYLCIEKIEQRIAVGQKLTALGFPDLDNLDLTRSIGIVTSLSGGASGSGSIQTNAGFARGMSGGPVLNDKGNVIGIIAGGYDQVPTFDFFTPVNLLAPLLSTVQGNDCRGIENADSKVSPLVEVRFKHENSILKVIPGLEAQDQKLIFIRPRKGLRDIGVTPGLPQFEGKRQGNEYKGDGVAYSEICGPIKFKMSGRIVNESSITLTGPMPTVNSSCVKVYSTDVVWTFDKIEPEAVR